KAGTDETCAMVDMRCFKNAEYQDNENFTEAALAMLSKELEADPSRIYLNLMELDTWGTGGDLKR
ncbi:MAG: phenylpyruvate tautomerase MIF-related protein, partial [Faecalibacterium sp.]